VTVLCRVLSSAQKAEAIHALPDDGARERVRRKLVHHAPEALGNLVQAPSQRAPGQGLVSKPADEAKEVEREGQGFAQRSGRLTAAAAHCSVPFSCPRLRPPRRSDRQLVVCVVVERRPSLVTEQQPAAASTSSAARAADAQL